MKKGKYVFLTQKELSYLAFILAQERARIIEMNNKWKDGYQEPTTKLDSIKNKVWTAISGKGWKKRTESFIAKLKE